MGKPVVHWELWSKDPEKVSSFYARIFDWKIQHIPELNYRMVDTGGEGIDVDDFEAYRWWHARNTWPRRRNSPGSATC